MIDGILNIFFGNNIKRKSEHKKNILVIPGFLCSDFHTMNLRNDLTKNNFKTSGWDLGYNDGLSYSTYDKLKNNVIELYNKNGKLVIIGWSLGGMYARMLSHDFPEYIDKIITLGTPHKKTLSNENMLLNFIYDVMSPIKIEDLDEETLEKISKQPPIYNINIYSKNDKVVFWENCVDDEPNNITRNFEVECGHFGFVYDAKTIEKIISLI